MPIRRRIIRRRCWRWKRRSCCGARRASARWTASEFLRGCVHHGARAGRDRAWRWRCRWKSRAKATSYQKVAQPASGFAIVGVAARVKRSGGKIALARIGVTGLARARIPRAECGGAAGRRRGRGETGGGGGGRRRGRQLRSVRLGRVPPASGAGPRGARARGGADEGVVKISGSYRLALPRERAYALLQDPVFWRGACRAARAWRRSAKTNTP